PLAAPLGEVWGDTRIVLPPAMPLVRLADVFTGASHTPHPRTREIPMRDLLARFPVALLTG
ncbi:MAG TPA: hypothetical protein VNK41_05365, partial [Vicinamibacterales bacterium]|nr:hypothetical protein [Vicinamibacterales bacterium]